MNKKSILAIIGVILVVVVIAVAMFYKKATPEPVFVVNPADTITSWDFKGDYIGKEKLENGARAEIKKEKELLASGEYTEYQVYTHIANQYHFLGDGENEMKYLEKALHLDATNTGLAWHNAGNLMKRLGALNSAKDAYAKALEVQPTKFYRDGYVEFMQEHFPDELQRLIEQEQRKELEAQSAEPAANLEVTI